MSKDTSSNMAGPEDTQALAQSMEELSLGVKGTRIEQTVQEPEEKEEVLFKGRDAATSRSGH